MATALTALQAGIIDRAHEALNEPHGHDPYDLAKRIGVLEWHLKDVLVLVGQLAGQDCAW